MRRFGGHLGTSVSALVDGQLDAESTERAWQHVVDCAECRGLVEREAWIKRRLSMMGGNEPSARLLGSLHGLCAGPDSAGADSAGAARDAWADVERIESTGRNRRRAGFALAGAGSVSAAVLGFAALGSLGLGGAAPTANISDGLPSSSPTASITPTVAEVHGRLRGWRLPEGASGVATAVPAVSR